jgi:hypothetical protein
MEVLMKKVFTFSFLIFSIVFLIAGCGKGKPKVFEVKELVSYTDDIYNFTIKYPGNWLVSPGSQKFIVFTDQASSQRFKEYTDKGIAGAKIEISVLKLGGDTTLESIMKKKVLPVEYSQPEKVTIDGVPAFKQTYKHTFSDGDFEGEVYYTTKDSKAATILSFEAFGGTLKEYKKTFDDILANVKLAVMPQAGMSTGKTDTIIEERPFPSETLKPEKGEGFTMMIPDNFKAVPGAAGRDILKSFKYGGERRLDCTIQVDMIDSKGNTLEAITEGHKSFPGANSFANTTLGGAKSSSFMFSPANDVAGKVYLTIVGNKCYRTTIFWYKPEQKQYLPIFEKCIKSLKFE